MDKGNKETIRLDDALKEVFAKQAEHAPQLPADFSQRVADAMQTRRRKARLRTIVGWSTLGAVAACLLLVFWLRPSKSPLKGDLTTRNIEERSERVPTVSSDSLVFEPIYKQIAQFSASIPDSPNKGFPHRGGTGGGSHGVLDYSKLAPGVYIEIDEEGDTVYVVISSQNVPTPPKSVLPEVNIAERMKEAEEFGKRLRQEFDSIHLAFNK